MTKLADRKMPEAADPFLNDAQRAILTTYAEGDFAHLCDVTTEQQLKDELDACGDGLLRFILVELASKEDCDTLQEAQQRIASAVRQLQEASDAVYAVEVREAMPSLLSLSPGRCEAIELVLQEDGSGDAVATQWSPTTGEMTDAQYTAGHGCLCPSCGSSAGISGGPLEVDGGVAWQRVDCSECGASWSDNYALTGYSDLEGGIDSEAVKSVIEDVRTRSEKYGFSVDGEAQAREVVSESCDVLGLVLSAAEIKIAVSALTP